MTECGMHMQTPLRPAPPRSALTGHTAPGFSQPRSAPQPRSPTARHYALPLGITTDSFTL